MWPRKTGPRLQRIPRGTPAASLKQDARRLDGRVHVGFRGELLCAKHKLFIAGHLCTESRRDVYHFVYNSFADCMGRVWSSQDPRSNRSVNPVWTWGRANRTLALSTANTGRCPCAGRVPGPDRLAVRRCLPDCRNARIPAGTTERLLPGSQDPGIPGWIRRRECVLSTEVLLYAPAHGYRPATARAMIAGYAPTPSLTTRRNRRRRRACGAMQGHRDGATAPAAAPARRPASRVAFQRAVPDNPSRSQSARTKGYRNQQLSCISLLLRNSRTTPPEPDRAPTNVTRIDATTGPRWIPPNALGNQPQSPIR